jgi:hypothetical protein
MKILPASTASTGATVLYIVQQPSPSLAPLELELTRDGRGGVSCLLGLVHWTATSSCWLAGTLAILGVRQVV